MHTATHRGGQSALTSQRFAALDGLRGVAALVVVFFHVSWSNHLTDNNFFKRGYLCVDLFFILSGFVIAAAYANRLRSVSHARDFLYLRFFRVYPLHFVMLLALIGLELFRVEIAKTGAVNLGRQPFSSPNSFSELVGNIFLIQGLGVYKTSTWNIPSWSISCEFLTYIIFASSSLSLLFRNKICIFFAILLASLAYILLAFAYKTLDVSFDLGIVRSICGFFFGMAVLEFSRQPLGRAFASESSGRLSAVEIGAVIAIALTMELATGWTIVAAIPCLIVLVTALQTDRGCVASLLKSDVAQFLGLISYSIYMTHYFLLTAMSFLLKRVLRTPVGINSITHMPMISLNPWVGDALLAAFVIAVLAFSAITYSLIEAPARAFGRRQVSRKIRKVDPIAAEAP